MSQTNSICVFSILRYLKSHLHLCRPRPPPHLKHTEEEAQGVYNQKTSIPFCLDLAGVALFRFIQIYRRAESETVPPTGQKEALSYEFQQTEENDMFN